MNDHPNPYDTINGYFDLPGDRTWGATGAIDISPDGETIWVAERCGTNSCAGSDIDPVVNFDRNSLLDLYRNQRSCLYHTALQPK